MKRKEVACREFLGNVAGGPCSGCGWMAGEHQASNWVPQPGVIIPQGKPVEKVKARKKGKKGKK